MKTRTFAKRNFNALLYKSSICYPFCFAPCTPCNARTCNYGAKRYGHYLLASSCLFLTCHASSYKSKQMPQKGKELHLLTNRRFVRNSICTQKEARRGMAWRCFAPTGHHVQSNSYKSPICCMALATKVFGVTPIAYKWSYKSPICTQKPSLCPGGAFASIYKKLPLRSSKQFRCLYKKRETGKRTPTTLFCENNNFIFFNQTFDKKRLKAFITWILKNSGEEEALKVIEALKEIGFRYATKAGISIGLNDLKTPLQKPSLVSKAQLTMNMTDQDFSGARITVTERSQRIIDTWHRASESLKKQVVDHFSTYDQFNPVYIMALSGARGNFSQVRQLIGMRGLMADQQGKIVNFPIRSNLREGLTLTEYFISCSGARKGLVDTALRTADTGYLTRRLVDVSHHIIVKKVRCNTHRGIAVKALQSYNKTLLDLKDRLVGRTLAEDIVLDDGVNPSSRTDREGNFMNSHELSLQSNKDLKIAKRDQEISPKLALQISLVKQKVYIRSPLTCAFTDSVCQLCYGWSMSQGNLVPLGEAVGVIAAQSIGEPGTQLTMRTFHTGGVFSGDLLQEIRAPYAGNIHFSRAFQGLLIRTAQGRVAFLTKTPGQLFVLPDEVNGNDASLPLYKHRNCLLPRRGNESEEVQIGDLLEIPPTENERTPNKIEDLYKNRHNQVLKESSASFVGKITDKIQKVQDNDQNKMPMKKSTVSLPEREYQSKFWSLPFQALTMLFVRQGEKVEKNQLLALFAIVTQEGNQPIKNKQTLFAQLSGKVVEDRGGMSKLKQTVYLRTQTKQDKLEELEEDLFGFIEPTKAGRLGFFRILATRLGATLNYSHPCKAYALPLLASSCPAMPQRGKKRQEDNAHTLLPLRGMGYTGQSKRRWAVHPTKSSICKNVMTRYVRTHNHLSQASFWRKDLYVMGVRPSPSFKKYTHPEIVQNTRFYLQTIAEQGDLVDENYFRF